MLMYAGSNMFELLVYYCGTLKNVTNDAANQQALVQAGSLHVLSIALATTVKQVCVCVCARACVCVCVCTRMCVRVCVFV